MISNLAVNEPDVPRLRVTTLLMLGPAAVSIVGAQLNDTALLLADSVEQRGADHRGAFEGRDAGEGMARPSRWTSSTPSQPPRA